MLNYELNCWTLQRCISVSSVYVANFLLPEGYDSTYLWLSGKQQTYWSLRLAYSFNSLLIVVDLHDNPTVYFVLDFAVVCCLAFRFYVGNNWSKWIWLGKNLVIAPRAPKLDIFRLKKQPQSFFFGVHLHKFGALAHVSTEDKNLVFIDLADYWTELPRKQLTNPFRID